MALREVRIYGDPILAKECKPVKEMTPRIRELIGDMFETMYELEGCGLAAPQVGILRQLCVIDTSDEEHEDQRFVLINPEIIELSGEQTGSEGCLSLPGKHGTVTRAQHVKVRALDENMEPFELEADDLLARCIQHECDHLHGHFYTEKVEGELLDNEEPEEEGEESEEGEMEE